MNDRDVFKKLKEDEDVENMQTLLSYRKEFSRELKFNASRVTRLEDLMSRASAKKWDAKKKQKMVRRLIAAQTSVGQFESILNQVEVQIDNKSSQAKV